MKSTFPCAILVVSTPGEILIRLISLFRLALRAIHLPQRGRLRGVLIQNCRTQDLPPGGGRCRRRRRKREKADFAKKWAPGEAQRSGFAGERRSKEAEGGRPAEARSKADFATTRRCRRRRRKREIERKRKKHQVRKKWDKFATTWDKNGMNSTFSCATLGIAKARAWGPWLGGCRKTQAFISLRVPPEARVRLPSWPQMASMVTPAGASIC